MSTKEQELEKAAHADRCKSDVMNEDWNTYHAFKRGAQWQASQAAPGDGQSVCEHNNPNPLTCRLCYVQNTLMEAARIKGAIDAYADIADITKGEYLGLICRDRSGKLEAQLAALEGKTR